MVGVRVGRDLRGGLLRDTTATIETATRRRLGSYANSELGQRRKVFQLAISFFFFFSVGAWRSGSTGLDTGGYAKEF